MDLSTLDLPETRVIHITHPVAGKLWDENDEPVTISVYGPGSKQALESRRSLMRDTASRAQRIAKKKALFTPEELEERTLKRLVDHTAEVSGLTLNGESITRDNIEKVYADPRFGWLADQVAEKIEDWDSFLA